MLFKSSRSLFTRCHDSSKFVCTRSSKDNGENLSMQVITIRYYCLCGTLATKQTPYFQSNSEIGRFAFQLKTVSVDSRSNHPFF